MENNINSILNSSLEELEYYSLLKIVSKFAFSDKAKESILNTRPSNDNDKVKREIELVHEMYNLLSNEERISFNGFEDYSQVLRKTKVINSVLNTDEILDVLDLISAFRRLSNYFSNINQLYPNIIALSNDIYHNRNLEKHITDIVADTGDIKDNASPELRKIRSEINDKSNRLRDRIQKILRKSIEDDIAQEDFVTIREDRFVIPIKASNKRTTSGIIHGVSASGQTVFFEPQEIVEMNNEISLLKNAEKREIYRLLEMLTNQISIDADKFVYTIEIVSMLDCIYAKAMYALENKGEKPIITDDNKIEFEYIKHPLLVNKLGLKKVVPLSINIDGDNMAYVISGPNAGGKTVALKTIGLSSLMIASGIFPIGRSKMKTKLVYTSIGDNQSIENDLSTFSSQISRIRDIINDADKNSLVLIDEICSGTDPQEGSALACGIMDTLIDYNINFVVTTHQSSLKNYALNKEIVKNASLEFDGDNLKPTYKFLAGLPGNSYAFNLAKSIGLNSEVMKRSEKYTFGGQLDLEKSISELNKIKKELEYAKNETNNLNRLAKNKEEEFNKKIAELNQKKQEIIQKSRDEAAYIVEKANKLIENTIQEIQDQKKSISDIKKEFVKEKEQIIDKSSFNDKPMAADDQNIKVGDNVIIDNGESVGQILEIDGKIYLVDFNGIKVKTKLRNLTKTDSKPKEKTYINQPLTKEFKMGTLTRLDMRGMRAEEAVNQLDKAISDCISNNSPEITIVHGKGTGALRIALREFLSNHHLVKNFREGELIEGGSGVTIVEI